MEEFLQTLLDQIRCKKAHALIRRELENHLEEQIQDYMLDGMTEEEAKKAAVLDMGDPVAIGEELNRIHRPQMEWQLIGLVGLMSVFNLIFQYFILRDCREFWEMYALPSNIGQTCFGMFLLCLLYRLDYTWIGKYAKILGGLLVAGLTVGLLFEKAINGRSIMVSYGIIQFSPIIILYLYIPIYAAILFHYRGGGKDALRNSLLWMIIPIVIAVCLPNLRFAIFFGVILSLILSKAVWDNWFLVDKKKFLCLYWLNFGVISLVCAISFQLVLAPDGITESAKCIFSNSQFVGNGNVEAIREMPNVMHTYFLTAVVGYYGLIAALGILGILIFFIWKIFMVSKKQKNVLGKMMGFSCGLTYGMMLLANIMTSFGALSMEYGDLPFFSAGGSMMLVSYSMAGIVLSIYRYKNIVS